VVRRAWLVAIVASLALAPRASAAELLAAYDRYETGKGFEIGIVNAATGVARTLPAGVNTSDDELHPALTPDGRFLVFTRMKLLPKLNGDIVAPAARSLIRVDLQTGATTNLGSATGAVFTGGAQNPELAFGIPVEPLQCCSTPADPEGFHKVARSIRGTSTDDIHASVDTTRLDIPHAASIRNLFSATVTNQTCQQCPATRDARYLTLAYHDGVSGALQKSSVRLSLFGMPSGPTISPATLSTLEFGTPEAPAGHAVPRNGDGYVAFDQVTGTQADIQSITHPGETTPTVAPAPVTTGDPERMPAWSPDGLKLGFVRTTGGRRKLAVFDLTPGLQTIVNPVIDLGADAPTPQTRQFQSVYGGLSLAEAPASTAVTCTSNCQAVFAASNANRISLNPNVLRRISGQTVGIFVVRVTGRTRTVLGRSQPRIKVVGRVPLGPVDNGRNRFRWNGRVNGKRLTAGTYLLTYRALKGARVTTTSGSIRFTITRGGKIRSVRALK
jgi:WD40-like Beta Propeller Repeat